MAQFYRWYRQVKVLRQGESMPHVRGMEEVSVNGRRQVRYFGDDDWAAAANGQGRLSDGRSDDRSAEFAREPWVDDLFAWPFATSLSSYLSGYLLGPSDIVDGDVVASELELDEKAQPAAAQPNPLREAQQNLSHGFEKVRRVVGRVPLALRAAWRELSQ